MLKSHLQDNKKLRCIPEISSTDDTASVPTAVKKKFLLVVKTLT